MSSTVTSPYDLARFLIEEVKVFRIGVAGPLLADLDLGHSRDAGNDTMGGGGKVNTRLRAQSFNQLHEATCRPRF